MLDRAEPHLPSVALHPRLGYLELANRARPWSCRATCFRPSMIENMTITGAVMFGHTWCIKMYQGALPMAPSLRGASH